MQSTKSEKSFSLADYPVSASREELAEEQKADETLKSLFELVNVDNEIRNKAGGYFIEDSVLLRKWSHADCFVGDPIVQVVVPVKFRPLVLETAHEKLTGHAGVQKTYDQLLRYFHWPRVKHDVASFVKTCKLTKPNVTLKPAPLRPIPTASQPFEHLIIDNVGPLPRSKTGCEYLLTVMCQTTRYPAAFPLRSINTKAIVKAFDVSKWKILFLHPSRHLHFQL